MTAEEIDREFRGLSGVASLTIVQERLGRPIPEGFQVELERLVAVAYETELRLVPGVTEALAQIPFEVCVASSGKAERVELILRMTGLSRYFEDRVFSAYQVERGKPFPDLFLHAARSLGAEPTRCAVIEDSVFGVQAGVAAGMRVFGYAIDGDGAGLSEAEAEVFHDMGDLLGMLKRSGTESEPPAVAGLM